MENKAGETVSIWMESAPRQDTPAPLAEDVGADVCIIGAGIAGLSTALQLAQEGQSVVVLEDGLIGSGMTQRTTAHLSNAIDDRYVEIERLHGLQGSRLAAQSHSAAIDRIEAVAAQEGIECDFERLDGYLFAPPGDSKQVLDRELEAARRAGLTDVEKVERAPLTGFNSGWCLRFGRQAQFHPLKYLHGVARAIREKGGRIYTATHAAQVQGGAQAVVRTSAGHTVSAANIVVATNTPITDIVSIHTKQAPYTTYVIGARLPAGAVTRALYWDTLDPYHFVRLQTFPSAMGIDSDILIVGGEDHKTGQADDGPARHAALEAWTRQHFPMVEKIEFRWSGQVMEPVDGLAFIGRDPGGPDNVYIATGDSGMGMTHGTIAGMLITDLIMGRPSSWAELYDPSRKTLRSVFEYAKENINVAQQYVSDLTTTGEVKSVEEIARGQGGIMGWGPGKVAIYRDEDGGVHRRSAMCRHLGCIVQWNSLEKTWDCPCHGSRYDRYGEVINGPANRGLKKVEE